MEETQNNFQKDLETHFGGQEKDIPNKILKAASVLFKTKEFKIFMDWWQEQQKEYADNLVRTKLENKDELFEKIKYLQGQLAESNLIRLAVVQFNKDWRENNNK